MNKMRLIILMFAIGFASSSASAQFFEKQKVVVWEIFARNNDVKVAPTTKQLIRTSYVDAFVGSRNYEVFEANTDDVIKYLTANGMTQSPRDIAIAVSSLYDVDFVLFSSLKVASQGNDYDSYEMLLTSELFSTETQKNERTQVVTLRSALHEIPGACAMLLGKLLGEQLSVQSLHVQSFDNQQQTSNNNPRQSQVYAQQSVPQNFVESALGLNMTMVYVEGGTFQMGATSEQSGTDSDESPVHSVTLDSYYISATEVTQAQWQAVMGTTVDQQASMVGCPVSLVGGEYPMYYINWDEARMFCAELSNITGKTYLLPTEAQWEFAARGGTKSRSNQFAGSYSVDAVAWYESSSGSKLHPVGKLRSNELGLYDMSGNVLEWCSDWYGSYSSNAQTNPTGPSSGSFRVVRGGSWNCGSDNCRVAYRGYTAASARGRLLGFRVVCLP